MPTPITLPVWTHAYRTPTASGKIKQLATDFRVDEQLSFQPEGTGEHVFLQIQKIGENTEYIARALARTAQVRQRDIGFAGLKDRHALTTQWFSVWLPQKTEPDWSLIETEQIKILHCTRHSRKLKRGVLRGNQFKILIRDFAGDPEQTLAKLENITYQGFPNYFAEQRFGNQGQNINTALELFAGAKMKPAQRGIYLSAARSFLFNLILAERIKLHNWNQAIAGDVFMFNQSHSYFKYALADDAVPERLQAGHIHPTGCLFGQGKNPATAQTELLESQILAQYPDLTAGLCRFGVEMDRRSLRVYPQQLAGQFLTPEQLELQFFLPAGSYATALLRELLADVQSTF